MNRQMINHRAGGFAEIIQRVTARLKGVFQTKNDVFILTGSGTGGMEAAVVNTLSPGDKVLAVCIGVFGERFATIAETFGAEVVRLNFDWGRAADPDAIARALDAEPSIKAVTVTHNETSTGVTQDLGAIAAVVRRYDKLLLVDAISSLGCIDLPVDEWGCDVVVTGSQKGWMTPPGLAFVSISEKAWRAHATAKMPRFYWDFTKAKDYLEIGQTPWTPALSVFYALDTSLELMAEEGLYNIFARHGRVGERARRGIKDLGLSLFADERYASNTVTAISSPDGIDTKRLLELLREERDIMLSGGQQRLSGKIFRIGHLGYVDESDIDEVLEGLRATLPKVGFPVAV
jgi:aspartate aminotransferase-like enzyme